MVRIGVRNRVDVVVWIGVWIGVRVRDVLDDPPGRVPAGGENNLLGGTKFPREEDYVGPAG